MFIQFLGGEDGEERQIWMLLGLGFCMGVFLATFQVGAESLFLQVLGEDYLDKAFFAAGGLGIISTAIFVNLQKRIAYSTLAVTNAFIIFLFVGASRAAFYFIPETSEFFRYLPFALFVAMGPITAITLLGFWGLFGRMFDTRQAKRIIGGIEIPFNKLFIKNLLRSKVQTSPLWYCGLRFKLSFFAPEYINVIVLFI